MHFGKEGARIFKHTTEFDRLVFAYYHQDWVPLIENTHKFTAKNYSGQFPGNTDRIFQIFINGNIIWLACYREKRLFIDSNNNQTPAFKPYNNTTPTLTTSPPYPTIVPENGNDPPAQLDDPISPSDSSFIQFGGNFFDNPFPLFRDGPNYDSFFDFSGS